MVQNRIIPPLQSTDFDHADSGVLSWETGSQSYAGKTCIYIYMYVYVYVYVYVYCKIYIQKWWCDTGCKMTTTQTTTNLCSQKNFNKTTTHTHKAILSKHILCNFYPRVGSSLYPTCHGSDRSKLELFRGWSASNSDAENQSCRGRISILGDHNCCYPHLYHFDTLYICTAKLFLKIVVGVGCVIWNEGWKPPAHPRSPRCVERG